MTLRLPGIGGQFTDEFKREAVALLASSGRPLTQIASELAIAPSMLRNWRNRGGGRNARRRCTRYRRRSRIPHRTRRRRSPGRHVRLPFPGAGSMDRAGFTASRICDGLNA
jgi:transposase-like protein